MGDIAWILAYLKDKYINYTTSMAAKILIIFMSDCNKVLLNTFSNPKEHSF